MKFLFVFFGLLSVCNSRKAYDGDQVWRIFTDSDYELSSIQKILTNYDFDIWRGRVGSMDFRVPHSLVQEMTQLWSENEIPFDVIIPDVGKLIAAENKARGERTNEEKATFAFDQYHTLDEIFAYLDDLSATSDLVSQEEIGRTIEGREIRLMKVSSSNGPTNKPAIWMDCGIHAREWISPATCLWGLGYLSSQYGINNNVTTLLDDHDFYILPVLNPDGYNYTMVEDRLWRKNRMQYSSEDCVGTDLNRNYDDGHWGGIGSSNRSCLDIYHGPGPFSELETSSLRSKVLSIQDAQMVKAFFSVHSYGQLWLFAFGWTGDLPPESDELYRVSQAGVDAIFDFSSSTYVNGPHYSTIYPASGTSVDWGYSVGIVNTFIVELRDTGDYGFLLPEDQILPTATEAWTGFTAAIFAI